MALTAAMIKIVTHGSWTPLSGDPTFEQLKSWAADQLAAEAPSSLTGGLYDRCHALLTAHMYVSSDETSGYKSYSTGGFSASQEPGQSIYLLEYRQILESVSETVDYSAETDCTRADADMPEFHLDQADVVSYFVED